MPLDPSRIGTRSEPTTRRWTTTDSLLYALAVGAGQEDPLDELELTTENSHEVQQVVVPSFAVVLGFEGGLPEVGTYDPARAVHAEQELEVLRPIAPEGEVRVQTEVTEMWDKGRDAILWTETRLTDPADGGTVAVCRTGAFLGGGGGFGGERGTTREWLRPERTPDVERVVATRPDQALLYRLTGDRNPLHSDPTFAGRAGFARPILHGMCTYGITTRVLLAEVCGGDPARLRAMSARFSRPVLPATALVVRAWQGETAGDGTRQVLFQVQDESGEVVLDRGVATVTAAQTA
ncbi:MaoC/PaaZ C-terminal domain-containing protein [Nocardioides campestrisoli]|uniref:MaoC/PaaZ C-terminal domain-containing protein n=1 Tax=Nocardioides campestrisoli TaxID=2736757 RepID=UPI00163DB3F2|nr:MaoC/PaaZ C-terminal domain-containing protein [Nocardioides campestrisoli]